MQKNHLIGMGEFLSPQHAKRRHAHPYMNPEFWAIERNQFWNNGMYSEESKEYLRTHIRQERVRSYTKPA